MGLPKVAYVLLWFPKPSETFIFREVANLWNMGLPLQVFTLYGELREKLSNEMAEASKKVERLGIPFLKSIPSDVSYWRRKEPEITRWLLRTVPLRRWSCLEMTGESIWAFFCGFSLARRFEGDKVDHIHAPWANGPATAAWVASKLTGIPFSFMGRAGDLFPEDGALRDKIRDAVFVRTNPMSNIEYLTWFGGQDARKIVLTYDGYPISKFQEASIPMRPPYQIVALGRIVRTKGFDILLKAAQILHKGGMDFHLTIGGDGPRGLYLKFLAARLCISRRVSFPGFVTHDRVSDFLASADIFVMPSVVHSTGDRDGIPNVIVEALLHRLPVVATDVAGIGEVIKDGETGRLVTQGDPWSLALAISNLTNDRATAIDMADRGRSLVLRQFDPESCHRNVFDLFQQFHKTSADQSLGA